MNLKSLQELPWNSFLKFAFIISLLLGLVGAIFHSFDLVVVWAMIVTVMYVLELME